MILSLVLFRAMLINALSRRPPDRTTGERCPGNGVDLIGLRRENTLGHLL